MRHLHLSVWCTGGKEVNRIVMRYRKHCDFLVMVFLITVSIVLTDLQTMLVNHAGLPGSPSGVEMVANRPVQVGLVTVWEQNKECLG